MVPLVVQYSGIRLADLRLPTADAQEARVMGGSLHFHSQTNDTKCTKDSLGCTLWCNNNLFFRKA